MLILDGAEQTTLAGLNAGGRPERLLEAIPLASGAKALSASLLTDCGPGQTWEQYGAWLAALPEAEVAAGDMEGQAVS